MKIRDLISHWKESGLDDFDTAQILNKAKKFDQSLFFCHLAIEKLLKGLVYKNTGEVPPKIHKLLELAQIAKLKINKTQSEELKEITTWNVQARYADIKFDLYKKADRIFTAKWTKKVKEIIKWLEKNY